MNPVQPTVNLKPVACIESSHPKDHRTMMIRKPLALVALTLLSFQASVAQTAPRRAPRPKPATEVAAQTKPVAHQTLPLKKVILYSNGVAYFERRGTVVGRAEIALDFKQSQVDDVLKSMLVLDLGKGRVGAVSYGSSAPPSARLAEIPFSIAPSSDQNDPAGGLAGALSQLQGAKVAVVTAKESVAGAVLTIERRKSQIDDEKPPLITNLLTLLTDSGDVVTFNLEEIRSVKLLDGDARKDLQTFAEASSATRRRDSKTIVVTSDGVGEREMLISYTVAAPIWKTTYRIALDQAGKPFFQGWAIVDNVSEEDWSNVALSLVSGTPASFIQPLQQPMFRYRPVMPLPENVSLTPQSYEPTETEYAKGVSAGIPGGVAGRVPGGSADEAVSPPPPPPRPMERASSMRDRLQQNSSTLGFTAAPVAPASEVTDSLKSGASGVETAATGGETGELFEYRISQPVTVLRNRSAMIPILQEQMDGERVSLYNAALNKERPMFGIRMENTSNLTLEGGPLAVLDGDAYAGESVIPRFKPKERRFITFGLDLGTQVKSKRKTVNEPVFLVRCGNGYLRTRYFKANKTVYTLVNQTDRPRTVYIEHPLPDGWKFSDDTEKPVSQTENVHRFRRELKPRETVELPVVERQEVEDGYALANLTQTDIEVFANNNYLDAFQKAAFEKILLLKKQIADAEERLQKFDEEIRNISEDQARMRENIQSLTGKSEAKKLIARYIAKADAQETRIEELRKEKETTVAEVARLRNEVTLAVKSLAFDRKL
jgi:hypothetical protein